MVLAYYGDERPEAELSRLLGTKPTGVRTEHLYRLTRLGYEVTVESSSFLEVESWLAEQISVIAAVDPTYLPGWSISHFWHAVAIASVTPEAVFCHDPMHDQAPLTATRQEFRDAWLDTDFEAAVITRPVTSDRTST